MNNHFRSHESDRRAEQADSHSEWKFERQRSQTASSHRGTSLLSEDSTEIPSRNNAKRQTTG